MFSEDDGRTFADSIEASFASISVKTGEGSGREFLEELTMRIIMKRIQIDAELLDGECHPQTKPSFVSWQNARYWY